MTDINFIRLQIGAVVSATFSDAEIQEFLTRGGSVWMACALAMKAWAAAQVAGLTSESIGDYAYKQDQIANAEKLAANFEKRDSETPAFDYAEMDLLDTSITTADDD